MKKQTLLFFEAVAAIVGTVVGAGVLGIPFAVAHAGFGLGLAYIAGLGIAVLSHNLLLGSVVSRTGGRLQMTGLAEKYLGPWGKRAMSVLFFFGMYGAMLAYIIGEGSVLQALFGGPAVFWSLLFAVVGGAVLYRGLKTVSVIELVMTVALFTAVVVLAAWSAPSVNLAHYAAALRWSDLFLPYGVILFALFGSSAIPVAYEIVGGDRRLFKRAIVTAGLLPIALYALFTWAVVGVTGSATTEVATVGLGRALGPSMLVVGNIFAFFSMGGSFLLLGTALQETYEWDYGVGPFRSLALVLLVPVGLFLAGARSFVQVLGIVGSLFMSIQAILTVLMYWSACRTAGVRTRGFAIHHAAIVSVALLALFSLAGIYSVREFFL